MREETRYLSNVYWSFRRYIAAQLPTIRRYYNPPSQPKPTDVNTWIIFQTGDYDPSLFAIVVPRIHCVSRVDEDGSALIGLVDDVVNIFDNKSPLRLRMRSILRARTERSHIPFTMRYNSPHRPSGETHGKRDPRR